MTAKTHTGLKPYKAFEARGKADDGSPAGTTVMRTVAPEDSMEIRRVKAPWLSPEWRHYMVPIYNGAFPDKIGLVYSLLTVEIEGEHLQPLLHAIRKKTCIYIQDYHPQEFEPPEPSQTIIHKITVTFRREGDEDSIIHSMPKNRKAEWIEHVEAASLDLADN